MIWATVSSQSYFCWLYRASPSLAAKNIINLISVLTIWWCPCIVFFFVVGRGCLLWWVCSLGKTLLAFALLHSVLQDQICHLRIISVQFSLSVMSESLQPHKLQHARPPCPSPAPRVHWNSYPSSQWCLPAISSSVIPFSSWPQSIPASESFPMSQLFAWGGQSTGVSALASFPPKNPCKNIQVKLFFIIIPSPYHL